MKIPNHEEAMKLSLEKACAFDLYGKTLCKKNIAKDEEYQKNFTNYYRVRRDDGWLKEFYKYFEENKDRQDITFEEILRHIGGVYYLRSHRTGA